MANLKLHLTHTLQCVRDIAEKKSSSVAMPVNGSDLKITDVLATAQYGSKEIFMPDTTRSLLSDNAAFVQKLLSEGKIIYGINTGYGGSADVRSDDILGIQKSLVRHLNAGFGEKFQSDVVRGAMLIRANSLCRGYSGVRPEVVQLLLDMIKHDIVPVVPKRGSISASGDLMPTSYIAACMMGREDVKVMHEGQESLAMEAFTKANIKPITFVTKEALAVVNASSFASSLASTILHDANVAAVLTEVATAMSVESLCGHLESFHPTLHECLPHEGQQEAARNIRQLLQGSQMTIQDFEIERHDQKGKLKQDRYALRTSPQWLAPVLETLLASTKRIQIEINSANDNPLIDHKKSAVLHGGNFQGISSTVAMDQARQSLQLCGKLLFAQMSEILNWKYSEGLPPNLNGSDTTTDFGFKGTDTAMASYCSELDYLTSPLTNHVLSAEMHNQAVNSMALVSARMTSQALDILQMMLANILRAQVQAIDLRWLQKNVEKILENLVAEKALKDQYQHELWPWYNFAFSPKETFQQLYNRHVVENGRTPEEFVAHHTSLVAASISVVKDQREGPKEIASYLGKGTREVYLYVRKTLDIPFYDGTHALDNSLEKIHQAIKSRQLEPLILSLFRE